MEGTCLAVVAVADAADEEFELFFVACWGHGVDVANAGWYLLGLCSAIWMNVRVRGGC